MASDGARRDWRERASMPGLRAKAFRGLGIEQDADAQERLLQPCELLGRPWGFATLPPLDDLLEQQRAQFASHGQLEAVGARQHSQIGASMAGFTGVTPTAAATSPQSLFIEAVQSSRASDSPYAVTAMAEAFHAAHLLQGLAGTLLHSPVSSSVLTAVADGLRQYTNSAWSEEAVRRGVAHAKSGEYTEARRCYDKALELDPRNVDALVARGAAHANEHRLQAALVDLQQAMALKPGDVNARRYLNAVQDRLCAATEQLPQERTRAGGMGHAPEQGENRAQISGRCADAGDDESVDPLEAQQRAGPRDTINLPHSRSRRHSRRRSRSQSPSRGPSPSPSPSPSRLRQRSRTCSSNSSGASGPSVPLYSPGHGIVPPLSPAELLLQGKGPGYVYKRGCPTTLTLWPHSGRCSPRTACATGSSSPSPSQRALASAQRGAQAVSARDVQEALALVRSSARKAARDKKRSKSKRRKKEKRKTKHKRAKHSHD